MISAFAIVFNDNDRLIINPFDYALSLPAFQLWINVVSEHTIHFPVTSHNIKAFFDSIKQNSIPQITWSNIHDFYFLSQEFALIDGKFKSDIHEFIQSNMASHSDIIDLKSNSETSFRIFYENLISIHLDQILVNQCQILDNFSGDQLYRILSKSKFTHMKILCKYLLSRYEKQKSQENISDNRPNSLLFMFLDCSQLSEWQIDKLAEISDKESMYIPNLIKQIILKQKNKIESLEKEIKQKKNEIETLSKSKNKLNDDNQTLRIDIGQLKEKIKQLEKEKKEIKESNEQSQRNNQNLKDAIGQLKTKIDQLGKKNNKIREQNEQLNLDKMNLLQSNNNLLVNLNLIEQIVSIKQINRISNPFSQQLTSITIPESVTCIKADAFFECIKLTEITVKPNNLFYKSVDGVLFTKDMSMIICCPSNIDKQYYTIPAGVTAIDFFSFSNCSKIQSITIPVSVTSIEVRTFRSCSNLSAINVNQNNWTYASLDGVLYYRITGKLLFCPCKNPNIMRIE